MPRMHNIAASLPSVLLIAALAIQSLHAQAPTGAQPMAEAQGPGAKAQDNLQRQFTVDFSKNPPVRFEAMNPGEQGGDGLSLPRRIAAAVVARDKPDPHYIADLGSYTGEFLEAFMERFPNSHGQWTEPVNGNEDNAKIRLSRFGDHVSYVIGCPSRDISQGCIPKDADVIITSWVSIHQPLDGMAKVFKGVYDQLPSGGWFADLDHVGLAGSDWEKPLTEARKEFHAKTEGPPVHLKTPAPTIEQQLAAFKVAGFDDVRVIWCSFTDVLFMAQKR